MGFMASCRLAAFAATCGALLPAALTAAPVDRFPERTFEQGSVRHLGGIPVVTVAGAPEEMGRQLAALLVRPGRRLLDYPRDYLRAQGADFAWPGLVALGRTMTARFPPAIQQEMDAIVAAGAVDRDRLVAGNTMFDIKKAFACSTLCVWGRRSAEEGPLLGRNLDFPTLGYLHEYTTLTVYRPAKKRAFASIGFPGLLGVISGMNDAGLSLAVLEVYASADGAAKFNPQGVPYAICFRRLLEECATVDEAARLLRTLPRTTLINLAVCDTEGGAVFEITPDRVEIRRDRADWTACTNHFRAPPLAADTACWRYERLKVADDAPPLSAADVWRRLAAVSDRALTLQTMVFEPKARRLRLAAGSAPSSAAPPVTIELAPLFRAPPAAP